MKWWSRVDDSDWGILCSRCARPNRHTSRRAASSRSAHHRTSLAQLFEWLWILSLSLSRQLAGSLLFSDPPYEPHLRCSRKNEKVISCGGKWINRVLLCSPCSIWSCCRASSSLNHHQVILPPPLFIFSSSHVRFLLMAWIEVCGYFSMAGVLLLLLPARWKPGREAKSWK